MILVGEKLVQGVCASKLTEWIGNERRSRVAGDLLVVWGQMGAPQVLYR